jgi:hypothetical protein
VAPFSRGICFGGSRNYIWGLAMKIALMVLVCGF